ncbi:MAG: electron transfer flavoprotein subunit beta/FixA family protein [Gammaproteobacteria bacterium]
MKILVAVKRVIDYSVRVRLKPDRAGVVTDGVKMSLNPFDEIALEEALRIRERGEATEVVVVTVGPPEVQTQLRSALAMGADRAIHVAAQDPIEPLSVAHILHALVLEIAPGLVMLGKQAIDDDLGQTGPMLAALWGRPQATFVSKLTLMDSKARAVREVDHGLETLELDLPAVITTDLRLNTPRFIKMPDIMKARQKPIDTRPLASFGLDLPKLTIERLEPPPERTAGIRVETVAELLTHLHERGIL